MREMSFSPRCLYARWTSAVCFFAAAAAAESKAAVRAWARLDDMGMAQSSDMVKRPRSKAEEATSVSEGATYLLDLAVTSGTGALPLPSVEELEELEASPRGRYLRVRPSPELSFLWPRFLRRPATFRRDVAPARSVPCPRRDLPIWPAESSPPLGRRAFHRAPRGGP